MMDDGFISIRSMMMVVMMMMTMVMMIMMIHDDEEFFRWRMTTMMTYNRSGLMTMAKGGS